MRTIPGVSYTVVSGPDGTIWGGAGKRDVFVLETATGKRVRLALPFLNCAVVSGRSRVWLGTAHGLYHVDVIAGQPLVAVPDATTDGIDQLSSDGSDGVWVIKQGRLWHAYRDGRVVMLSGAWPAGEYQPYAIAPTGDGHLWVGGAGRSLRSDRVR